MPGWLVTVLVLGTIFVVIPVVWERMENSGGKAGKVAKTANTATEFVGTALQKGVGAVFLILGLIAIYMLFTSGFEWWRLAGFLLVAYGVHLLLPGERSFTVFW